MKTPEFFDSNVIFENAIRDGILSDKESDQNYAGNFMYMYSKNGIHYFKNIITREYGWDKKTINNACPVFTNC